MIGINPAAVVNDVRIMARKRLVPDSMTACFKAKPFCLALFTKSIMIRLSLTTTPDNATSPNSENMLIALPKTMCPTTAPINPNGMTDMMIKGWL